MKYNCRKCRKTLESQQVKFVLVEEVSNKPRIRVCMNCHTRGIKTAAKDYSQSFLPGAKLGL